MDVSNLTTVCVARAGECVRPVMDWHPFQGAPLTCSLCIMGQASTPHLHVTLGS